MTSKPVEVGELLNLVERKLKQTIEMFNQAPTEWPNLAMFQNRWTKLM